MLLWWRTARLAGIGGLALGLCALAPDRARPGADLTPQRGALPEMRFTITDSSLRGTREARAGHLVLHVDNKAARPHQVALWLVPRGKTRQQEIDSMRLTGRPPRGLIPFGGIGPLPGGQQGSMLMRLPAGEYIVYCTLNGTDGDAWFTHGVLATLDVTGEPNLDLPYELAFSGIQITEARIQFGATIKRGNRRMMSEGVRRRNWVARGQQSIQIESFAGPTHAMVMLKSDDPTQMARYVAWLDGRGAPPNIVTGLPAVPPGQRVFLRVSLTPGGYILFCPNRHERTGLRGYQTGEFTQFAVK